MSSECGATAWSSPSPLWALARPPVVGWWRGIIPSTGAGRPRSRWHVIIISRRPGISDCWVAGLAMARCWGGARNARSPVSGITGITVLSIAIFPDIVQRWFHMDAASLLWLMKGDERFVSSKAQVNSTVKARGQRYAPGPLGYDTSSSWTTGGLARRAPSRHLRSEVQVISGNSLVWTVRYTTMKQADGYSYSSNAPQLHRIQRYRLQNPQLRSKSIMQRRRPALVPKRNPFCFSCSGFCNPVPRPDNQKGEIAVAEPSGC